MVYIIFYNTIYRYKKLIKTEFHEERRGLGIIVDEIKLLLLNNNGMADIDDAADFYNVNTERISSILRRSKDDFINYEEMVVFRGELLKEYINKRGKSNNIRNLSILSEDGMIRVGLLIQNNVKAESLKSEFLMNINNVSEKFKKLLTGKSQQILAKQFNLGRILRKSLGGLVNLAEEVKIDKYRADFLINEYIIIECDEYGHKNYDKLKEAKREKILISKGYEIIRFNPDSNDCPFELINKIMKTIHMNNCNSSSIIATHQAI